MQDQTDREFDVGKILSLLPEALVTNPCMSSETVLLKRTNAVENSTKIDLAVRAGLSFCN